jgi:Holliday junction resolvasome RuvABC endonuclease subunit
MVMSLLNLKDSPKYTDVTDALALAIAYNYLSKFERLKAQMITE